MKKTLFYRARLLCSRKKGFTLYFAILIGAVILVIGASMLNLALKEFVLTASARESEIAFYAADSGAECALYWDVRGYYNLAAKRSEPVFVKMATTAEAYFVDENKHDEIRCNAFGVSFPDQGNISFPVNHLVVSEYSATTTFYYNTGPDKEYCALVRVSKRYENAYIHTEIDSRGYNMPCSEHGPPLNRRAVERALLTKY